MIDLRKELAPLYRPKAGRPSIVDVPSMAFLMIDGSGPPEPGGEYADAIQTLYPVVYTLKFRTKATDPERDFSVMPLETLWRSADGSSLDVADRAAWTWTAMIAVPDGVRKPDVATATREAAGRRALPLKDRVRLARLREGRCAQVLHVGPYDREQPTIEALAAFIHEQGLEPSGAHHEIYLSDPNRTAPERLRTIVRQPVRKAR